MSQQDGQVKAEDLNAIFIETSAKTGYNVKRMFMRLASALPPTGSVYDVNPKNPNTLNDKNTWMHAQPKSSSSEFEVNKPSSRKSHFCQC